MVLKILAVAYSYFPTEYTVHAVTALVVVLSARAISQGRKTTRERDLHARVILLTGAFSPTGLTLLESLAQRGAHIIALCAEAVDSEKVTTYIELLRSTTSNAQIFAEQCDLASPPSIQAFCARFLSGQEQRLDALLFTHEFRHVGALRFLSRSKDATKEEEGRREEASLATFLLTTLLLPALLTAPVERDIRIVNVVNRFYPAAAAAPSMSLSAPFALASASTASLKSTSTFPTPKSTSTFLLEGARALRTILLTRHLQRILDSLPAAQIPKTSADGHAPVPVVSPKAQKSNIVAVSVSPGISRVETVAPLLNADWVAPGYSLLGIVLYILAYPLLLLLTKSSAATIQSVLHVLFLPTPFKVLAALNADPDSAPNPKFADAEPEEVLKPGALYAECAVVRLDVGVSEKEKEREAAAEAEKRAEATAGAAKGKGKGKHKGEEEKREEVLEVPDDGELGGELAGRLVWEAYEAGLKAWEAAHPPAPAAAAGGAATGPAGPAPSNVPSTAAT
ncbi:hypothetical protein DFH07DRAFT_917270 [Mycena maculata]|uniref:Ketoreductase (KR) domain-containing protein n=1 Tax=Mycena maculata TaxID=230809 RepID=A0AAD7JEG7_9AGAR|nr:hypothetical protein DFH07DRAFT_917270 [Mycena maculata]